MPAYDFHCNLQDYYEEDEMFHIATPEEIKEGKITDVYFQRTMEILKAKGINKRVVGEVWAKTLPYDYPWAIFAGLEEVGELFKGMKVKINSIPEGTLFHTYEPLLEIEGYYNDFGVYETALLGFICQASGIATAAARCRKAAGQNKSIISFGARRMHPAIAPMIERAAFIGGCDGVAVSKSAEILGQEAQGTMPHALILVMGDTIEAMKAFNEIIPSHIRRISLIDTFNDEKFEAIRVAEAMGKDIFALRLDTPSSRRGNFFQIFKEVRWELDIRGFSHIKLFASGGLDEKAIMELNTIVDGYGIGTFISDAPVVDFSFDIVEIDGEPLAKRGKPSGRKRLMRCERCFDYKVSYFKDKEAGCPCGGQWQSLTKPFIEEGTFLKDLPTPQDIRNYVLTQLSYD